MKRIVSLFLLFALIFPVIMTASAPNASGQTVTQKVTINKNSSRCTTQRRKSSNVCKVTCVQRDEILRRLALLESKPAAERTPDYSQKFADTLKELAAADKILQDEIARLDKKIDDMATSFDEKLGALAQVTTTKITETNNRITDVETNVAALQNRCYGIAVGKKLVNSCTGQKIKTGGGFSLVDGINLGLNGLNLFLNLRGGGGGNSGGGNPPPVVRTNLPTLPQRQ